MYNSKPILTKKKKKKKKKINLNAFVTPKDTNDNFLQMYGREIYRRDYLHAIFSYVEVTGRSKWKKKKKKN